MAEKVKKAGPGTARRMRANIKTRCRFANMKSSFWLPIVLLFSTFRRNESILFILFNKNECSSLPSAPVSAAGVSFARPSHFVDMRGARRSLRDSKHAKVTTRSRYRYEACAGGVSSGAAYLSTRTLRPRSQQGQFGSGTSDVSHKCALHVPVIFLVQSSYT